MDTPSQVPVQVNYREVWRRIKKRRKLFYKVLPLTFIISAVYIFSIPRTYFTDAMLAPENENELAGGAFGSIASTFGIDLGEGGSDAIGPMLYPNLLEDNAFIVSLYSIHVETIDGTVSTDYHDYLLNHQQQAWWGPIFKWLGDLIGGKKSSSDGNGSLDPYALSRKEDAIVNIIRRSIGIDVDKKTGVISISVEDQDPKVCKIVADALINRLQDFITEYRTNKARRDVEYYSALADSAMSDYKMAVQAYNYYADHHTNVVMPSYRTKATDLENEMQLRYNSYTVLNTQLQNARAKVQERTPAFTLLKGAAIPIKPSTPKRMFFIAFMLFLASAATSCYILKDILIPDDCAEPAK
jgi:uncharacterized protein involved in exopolysaccharide biosynthesis